MLVSVIIPVYNTPVEYLKKCIDSIYQNTLKTDIELIVVDDGSDLDKSFLYEQYVKQYKTAFFIKQKHSGVSAARNKGIEISKGDYIAFCDADDIIINYFIDEAADTALDYDADIVAGRIDFAGRYIKQSIPEKIVYKNTDIIKAEKALLDGYIQKDGVIITGSPCAKLYKKNTMGTTRFDEQVTYCEDQLFNIRLFGNSKTIVCVPQDWYIYQQNDFSAIHTAERNDYVSQTLSFFDSLMNLMSADQNKEIKQDLIIMGMNILCSTYQYLNRSNLSKHEKKEGYKKLDQNRFVRYLKDKASISQMPVISLKCKLLLIKTNWAKNMH